MDFLEVDVIARWKGDKASQPVAGNGDIRSIIMTMIHTCPSCRKPSIPRLVKFTRCAQFT
jgi:hypothetical protein